MKKLFAVCTIAAASMLALTGCGSSKETLKIYNAGEYIDTSLITKFEKENDCKKGFGFKVWSKKFIPFHTSFDVCLPNC